MHAPREGPGPHLRPEGITGGVVRGGNLGSHCAARYARDQHTTCIHTKHTISISQINTVVSRVFACLAFESWVVYSHLGLAFFV